MTLAIADGGTGATTAAGARANLGADVAANVNFMPVGAGAAARTVQQKLDERISSADFATLQGALTAAAGKVLTILPGTYGLSSTLTVPAGTTIEAYGATLTWNAQMTGLSLGSGVRVFGGTYVGPGGATYVSTGCGIRCSGTPSGNPSTSPTFVDGPLIRDVTIRNWGAYGVLLEYCRKARVLHNLVEVVGYAGIGGASVEDAWIERNRIDWVDGAGAPDTYGIFCDRGEGTLIEYPQSKRIRIAGNIVRNVPDWEGIDTHGGEDFEIVHNHVEGCRFGIVVIGAERDNNVRQFGAKRVRIAHNTVIGSTAGAAITLGGANVLNTVNDYAEDCQIVHNIITGGGRDGDSDEGAIRVYATKRLLVEGNQLNKPRRIGIHVVFENLDVTVQNNVIVDCCDDVFASPAHIRVTSNKSTGTIVGNTNVFCDAAAAANVSVVSIEVAGALTGLDLTIRDNKRVNRQPSGDGALILNFGTTAGVHYHDQKQGIAILNIANVSAVDATVTFDEPFPGNFAPVVQLSLNSDPFGGGSMSRTPTIGAFGIGAAGFTARARGTNFEPFGGDGTYTVGWTATVST